MSEERSEIKVYESRRFGKTLNKLSDPQLKVVEDEVEKVIADPEIGEQKRGDLAHLRVHKFRLDKQLMLLGYSWLDGKLEIYLLQLGPHENFYQKMKGQNKADSKLMK